MVNLYSAEEIDVGRSRFHLSLKTYLFPLLCCISVGGSAQTPGLTGDLTAVHDFAALGEEARQRRLPALRASSPHAARNRKST